MENTNKDVSFPKDIFLNLDKEMDDDSKKKTNITDQIFEISPNVLQNVLKTIKSELKYDELPLLYKIIEYAYKVRPKSRSTLIDLYFLVAKEFKKEKEFYYQSIFTDAIEKRKSHQDIDLFPGKSISKAIEDDNEKLFLELLNLSLIIDPILDIERNKLIKIDVYEYIVYLGSYKCFMAIKDKIDFSNERIIELSVAGGNKQIIDEIAKNNVNVYGKYFKTAVQYHRNDICNWIVNSNAFTMISESQCKISFNYRALFFLKKYKLDVPPSNYFKNPFEDIYYDGFPSIMYAIEKKEEEISSNLLLVCCLKGYFDIVEYLIEKCKIDINKEYEKKSALSAAIFKNNLPLAKYLIGKGANIRYMDKNNYTLLHIAASKGYLECTKFLIENYGLEFFENLSKLRLSVIILCIFSGKLEMVKYLSSLEGIDIFSTDMEGNNLLHLAAFDGNNEIICFLIDKLKFDVKSKSKSHNIPLSSAVKNGHFETVKLLVEKYKSPINYINSLGMNILHIALNCGHFSIAEYIGERSPESFKNIDKKGNNSLAMAVVGGDIDCVKYVVKKCGRHILNQKDKYGNNALHKASYYGYVDIAKYFIEELHLDINERDKEKKTILHKAASSGSLSLVKYLIEEKGMDYKALDNIKNTPFHCAARAGNLEIVKYFAENTDSDIDQEDDKGDTALFKTVLQNCGHLYVMKYLIEYANADLMHEDKNGNTILHIAAYNNFKDIIKYILDNYDFDVNKKNKYGDTPLCSAATMGNLEVVKLLSDEYNASVSEPNYDGNTPLHCAILVKGSLKVVEYLTEKYPQAIKLKNKENNDPFIIAKFIKKNKEIEEYLLKYM